MIKTWWKKQQTKRRLKKFQQSIEVIESMGYACVKMYEIAGTLYIEDKDGTKYGLKSQGKKRGK